MSASRFQYSTLTRLVLTPALAILLMPGCGESSGTDTGTGNEGGETAADSEGSGSGSDTSSGDSSSGSTTSGSGTDSTTAGTDGTTSDGTTSDGSGGFVPDVEIGSMCDPMAQDCPEGEKCVAYSTDGDGPPSAPWDANKCVEETGDLVAGDPCDIEGGKYTGIDDCVAGTQCLMTDDDGFGGVCVEFCDSNMTCDQPTAQCNVVNNGALPLCLDSCDPLVQDCPDGQGCFNAANSFVCFKHSAEGGEGTVGADCGFINACLPGNMCLDVAAVQDCDPTFAGCCAPFCAISEGGATCQSMEECLLVIDPAPPGYGDVGVCSLPQ